MPLTIYPVPDLEGQWVSPLLGTVSIKRVGTGEYQLTRSENLSGKVFMSDLSLYIWLAFYEFGPLERPDNMLIIIGEYEPCAISFLG